jgi:hypothetical protein
MKKRACSLKPARLAARAVALLTLVGLLCLTLSPVLTVRADNVQNDVADVISSDDLVTITAGGSASVGFLIDVTGAGSLPGCDATVGSPATLWMNAPAGVVASPSALVFSACDSYQFVSFSSATAGTYSISPSIEDLIGKYNVNPAAFTLRVNAAPANTIPQVSVTGVTDGAIYEIGTVPDAGCLVVDTEDTGESANPVVSGMLTNGLGSQIATCAYTDSGALTATASASFSIVDTGFPAIDCTAPDSSTWYGANQTVTCTASDGGSGLANVSDSSFSLSTDVANGTHDAAASTGSRQVCDNAGNCVTAGPFPYRVDMAPPTITSIRTFTSDDAAYPGGWTRFKVTVTFYCNDNGGSGGSASSVLESHTPVNSNGEVFNGAITSDSGCIDPVGNASAQGISDLVQVDKADPIVSPGDVNNITWRNSPLSQDFTASDPDSGLKVASDATFTLTAAPESTLDANGDPMATTVSRTVEDSAGNSTTRTLSALIDMTDPTITASAKTADGQPYVSGAWTNQSVIVSFECDDTLSGIGAGACPSDVEVSVNTSSSGQSTSDSVSDRAGNSASSNVIIAMVDKTAPTIAASAKTADGNDYQGGWTNQNVTITFECSDVLSGLAAGCPAAVVVSSDTAAGGLSVSEAVSDAAGNTSASTPIVVQVDKTAPSLTLLSVIKADATAYSPGVNNWSNQDVTVTWACADALSGPLATTASDTMGEGASQIAHGSCDDNAGNTASASEPNINVDKTAPTNIAFVGGPRSGSGYYFGSVPSAPTCTAEDALSGLDGPCAVTGYATTVGTHVLIATATDNAGNVAIANRSYAVLAWTPRGFYAPVDMNGTVNTVKAGSTVPLKFEVFAGATELTDTGIVVGIKVGKITMPASTPTDEIETTATGGTSLRYDATSGQFIYNWSTKGLTAGQCYQVTLTLQDGSTIIAYFKMK